MQKLFNNILVPVDFSANSIKLFQKAIEFAYQYNCRIHLLHVITPSIYSYLPFGDSYMYVPSRLIDNKKELEARMEKYYSLFNNKKSKGSGISYSILQGSWNDAILNTIDEENIDLVLTPQIPVMFTRNIRVNPDKIVCHKKIPVITVPPGRDISKLRSILIPVTDFLPGRKLIYGMYLASAYNATVRLVGIENNTTKSRIGHFLNKAKAVINDHCDIPVRLEKIKGDNIAASMIELANHTPADLVIVNPGTQTKMPGLFSKLWGKIMQRYSPLPVLTINSGITNY